MKNTTLIMLLGSMGFIIIGLISLLSKRIKRFLKESGVYKNIDKFTYYNGIFNLSIGLIGIILGLLDNLVVEKSKYIIIVYILYILIVSIIQNRVLKKYKNI